MSLFLIVLAAGDSKRFRSSTPKVFQIVNNKTLLEHALNAFKDFHEIKKTLIVYNKKHRAHLNKLNLKNTIKIEGINVVVVKKIIYLELVSEPNFFFLLSSKIL